MKIRHYGILSSRKKSKALACARKSLRVTDAGKNNLNGLSSLEWLSKGYGKNKVLCPKCKSGTMSLVAVIFPVCRGSPLGKISANLSFYS
jgi:hypothetical protein